MVIEARLALTPTEEIKELDERIEVIVRERAPDRILTSAPGVGAVTGGVVLTRLGDASRLPSLAAARSFSGLIPSLDSSGDLRQARWPPSDPGRRTRDHRRALPVPRPHSTGQNHHHSDGNVPAKQGVTTLHRPGRPPSTFNRPEPLDITWELNGTGAVSGVPARLRHGCAELRH
jgi:hypothetical protein